MLKETDTQDAQAVAIRRVPQWIMLHAVVFVLYAVITLFFWAPVLTELDHKFIGDGGDTFQFVWNAWWTFETVCDGHNPYYCDLQFVPFGIPLVFHTLSAIPSFFIGAAEQWLGMPVAYNAMAFLLCCMAGLCMFALARWVTGDITGSFVAGILFMICPFMSSKLLGHLNLLCAAMLPLYTMCLFATVESPRAGRRWALAIVFLVMLFSNIHTVIFAGNVTGWYYLYRVWRSGQWKAEAQVFWKALKPTIIFCALAGIVSVYYVASYRLDWISYRNLRSCPEPLNFLLPIFPTSRWLPQYNLVGDMAEQLTNLELSVYLGWSVLPLSVIGFFCLRKHPVGRFAGILFLCALILSAGHKLQWHRQVVTIEGMTCYLPMGLYRYVPFLGSIGQSGRYMVIGYMAMGVGVAGLIAYIRQRHGRKAAATLAIVSGLLICMDFAYLPPTVDVPVCAIPPGPGRVFDPRLSNASALFCQTVHGRPLVGGYIARIATQLRQSYASMDGIGWFFQATEHRGDPPASAELIKALRDLNIEYVCVDQGSAEAQVLRKTALEVFQENERDLIFRLRPAK